MEWKSKKDPKTEEANAGGLKSWDNSVFLMWSYQRDRELACVGIFDCIVYAYVSACMWVCVQDCGNVLYHSPETEFFVPIIYETSHLTDLGRKH